MPRHQCMTEGCLTLASPAGYETSFPRKRESKAPGPLPALDARFRGYDRIAGSANRGAQRYSKIFRSEASTGTLVRSR
jgi:hypothetical protein